MMTMFLVNWSRWGFLSLAKNLWTSRYSGKWQEITEDLQVSLNEVKTHNQEILVALWCWVGYFASPEFA